MVDQQVSVSNLTEFIFSKKLFTEISVSPSAEGPTHIVKVKCGSHIDGSFPHSLT